MQGVKSRFRWWFFVTSFLLSLGGGIYFFFFHSSKKREEEILFDAMTRIDVKKLAASLQKEDPATIALMLSYLEPKRAEQMIAALPETMQEKVLLHLGEMEYDSD